MIIGGNVRETRRHRQSRNEAICCSRFCVRIQTCTPLSHPALRERVRLRVCTCVRARSWSARESQNVIRLTDIKLKYPFWEFAASRVDDLQRCFLPGWFFHSAYAPSNSIHGFLFVCTLSPRCVPTWMLRGKNRIFPVTLSKGQTSCWGDKLERWYVGEFDLSVGRIDALAVISAGIRRWRYLNKTMHAAAPEKEDRRILKSGEQREETWTEHSILVILDRYNFDNHQV